MAQIEFTVPVNARGDAKKYIAYGSERRKNTFVVAEVTGLKAKAAAAFVFTVHSRFAQHKLPNFVKLALTALYDGEESDSEVHSVEVCVMWRGIEKFKAVYSLLDCTSEILLNRWSK